MATFDVHDQTSWYFGPMSRLDATELLMNETELGVFLVRDSNTIIGDFVLCVREKTKVGHYIINKIDNNDQIYYRIGDRIFVDLPELLHFYKSHCLDKTPLIRPAVKIITKTDRLLNKIERVIGKFDFDGSDQDDLPFRRGEILTIVNKDEDQWWTAKNVVGQIGQIPVPYVQTYENNAVERPGSGGSGGGGAGAPNLDNFPIIPNNIIANQLTSMRTVNSAGHQLGNSLKKSDLNRKLPALARVKQTRIPNAYDKTALKLEVGDIINVTKTNINGQWEGELKGKRGHFPFTHVEFIEDNNDNNFCNLSISATQIGVVTTAAQSTTTSSNNMNTCQQQQQKVSRGNNESTSPGDIGNQQSQHKQQIDAEDSEIILCNNQWI